MPTENLFPSLTGWEPTRQTLHLYSQAVGVITRAHAPFHPRWWHISLKVQPDGLVTETMKLPDGGSFWLRIDLCRHKIVLVMDEQPYREFQLAEGLSSTQLGDRLIEYMADLGLQAEYAREKYENDTPRFYDPEAAGRYLIALVNADRIFKEHRATLSGNTGPVQVWPHGFDLAFEWFGTRVETNEHDGQLQEHPSQINLGFYPGSTDTAPYFYSNPWPFEAAELLDKKLPPGAKWFTDGWQGSILPYDELAGDSNAEARLREYARRVFEISSPTLLV